MLKEKHIFYFLLFLHILYVLLIPVFITQDGPSHLYNSHIFNELIHDPGSFYHQYYELNTSTFPNWASTVGLSLLLLILPVIWAEKIYLLLLIALLPLSFRYMIKKINPSSLYLSSLAFLFTFNFFLFKGFYNFQLSLSIFCWTIGVYYQHKEKLTLKPTFFLSSLLCLLFFTHPIALMVAMLFISTELIVKDFKKNIYPLTIILVPSASMMIYFLSLQEDNNSLFVAKKAIPLMYQLLSMEHLAAFSAWEVVILGVIGVVLGVTAIAMGSIQWKNLFSEKNLPLFLIGGGLLIVYFFVSDALAGGSYLTSRITVFIYFTLILLFSSIQFSHSLKTALLGFITISIIALTVIKYDRHSHLSEITQTYLNTSKIIPEEAIVLPLSNDHKGIIDGKVLSPYIFIFKHLGNYKGAMHTLCLDNYEANTTLFPVRWKQNVNPYKHLSKGKEEGLESTPPSIDITNYIENTGITPQYIIFQKPTPGRILKEYGESYLPIKSTADSVFVIYQVK